MVDNKAEEVLELSEDGDAGDCGVGTESPASAPATVPKKRGRPANLEKPKKIPSGRGRGRPARVADGGGNKTPAKAAVSGDASEEEGTANDGGSPIPNGDKSAITPPKRGRHSKRKRKLPYAIESTGKGRGRPKTTKAEVGDDDEEIADEDDAASAEPVKKTTPKVAKKGRGRPKKVHNSDDESADDTPDEEAVRRPVGRNPSGGINLNIVSTGRGQGRPKKEVAAKRAAIAAENGDGKVSKKPGRPTTSAKGAYLPTGKPRGRPKAVVEERDSQNGEDHEDEENAEEDLKKNSDNSACNSVAEGDEVDKQANSEESDNLV